jgi:hypothetical protein
MRGWSTVGFAKLIFFIIVSNEVKLGGDTSFEGGGNTFLQEFTKEWETIFRNLVSNGTTELFQSAVGLRKNSRTS